MDCLDLLASRRSTPSRLLAEPGPDSAILRRLLAAAVRVPDHGKLTPWRFLQIRGDSRHALGELLAKRSRELNPSAADAVIEKDRNRFNHAPVIVTVIACLTPGHKVPECEQIASGNAVCFSLLLAAQAAGFSAQWLTGWAAYDSVIKNHLGIREHERILGFIHIGSASETVPERQRPDIEPLLSEWVP